MTGTTRSVATPYGAFVAQWDEDESIPVSYAGDADAIAYFKAYLDLTPVSGRGGARLTFDTIEPADLCGFCQSKEYGIVVTPYDDDFNEEAYAAM